MSQRKRKPSTTRVNPQQPNRQSAHTTTTKAPTPAVPPRPAPDDTKGWKAYWNEREQPWRREPEIDATRQQELTKCYAIVPDVEQGRYRLGGMKLNRADVEWLLATYKASFTPTEGLDVRGAILNGENLSELPLIGLRGGVTPNKQGVLAFTLFQLETAATQMKGSHFGHARLQGAYLIGAQLQGASFYKAQLQGSHLNLAQLQGAHLVGAQLQGSHLNMAQLEGANLFGAKLQGVNLIEAKLQDANLNEAWLEDANLNDISFTNLQGIGPQLADVRWNGVNLAAINWSQVKILRNDYIAQQKKDPSGSVKPKYQRLREYQEAARANRQLAVALQSQGLNEEAARFAYQANRLQCSVLWFQMTWPKVSFRQRVQKFGAWLFSHLLDLLAGYGYKPGRSFLAYLIVVFGFMGLYLLTSHFVAPHLSWDEALVLSLSSFHGRGFFTQTLTLGDPFARLAVAEAVLGLFVEVSLIATFTQRFFGK